MDNWLKSTTLVETGQSGRARSGRHADWLVLALLVALVAFSFRGVLFSGHPTWMVFPDIAYQVLPWYQLEASEVRAGRLPLWDAHQMAGQSLIGQAIPGVAFPLNWLVWLAPLTEGGWIRLATLSWYFVGLRALASLFAFLLCRDLGCGRAGALAGGLTYGLSGFVGSTGWPQMLGGAIWGPLILLFVLRALRGYRIWTSAVSGGLCLGLAVLSGHHQVPLYFGLMAAGLWLWAVLNRRSAPLVLAAVAFFAVAGLTSGLQALPAWEYSRDAVRWVGLAEPIGHDERVPYSIHHQYSAPASAPLGLLFANWKRDCQQYASVPAIVLAAWGVVACWGSLQTRIGFSLAVGGVLFSFGSAFFLHGVLYAVVPVLEKARSPKMAIVVAHLGLSLLVALGLSAIGQFRNDPRARSLLCMTVVFALASAAVHGLIRWARPATDPSYAVELGAALALVLALYLYNRGWLPRAAVTAVLFGLMMLGFEWGSQGVWSTLAEINDARTLQPLLDAAGDAERLKSMPAPQRVVYAAPWEYYNFGDWAGVDSLSGYVASAPRRYLDSDPWTNRMREVLGVGLYVGTEPKDAWTELVASLDGDRRIYRNPQAMPPVWSVHRVKEISREQTLSSWYQDPHWDPRREALVEENVRIEACTGPDEVRLLRRENDRVVIWAEMACRGLVVLNDNYSQGWQAWVDKHPAPILPAYRTLRGVVVPAGSHLVEMRYRPASVRIGAVMTLAGAFIVALVGLAERSSARPSP